MEVNYEFLSFDSNWIFVSSTFVVLFIFYLFFFFFFLKSDLNMPSTVHLAEFTLTSLLQCYPHSCPSTRSQFQHSRYWVCDSKRCRWGMMVVIGKIAGQVWLQVTRWKGVTILDIDHSTWIDEWFYDHVSSRKEFSPISLEKRLHITLYGAFSFQSISL